MRYPVWITANCRSSMGRLSDIILSDLSTEGCGVTAAEGLLKQDSWSSSGCNRSKAWLARVVWVKGKKAGVKFERPLYGPVVEHLVKVQLNAAPPRRYCHAEPVNARLRATATARLSRVDFAARLRRL